MTCAPLIMVPFPLMFIDCFVSSLLCSSSGGQLATHASNQEVSHHALVSMLKNGSTRSCEETKELGIVYDRDANVVIVSNPCCVVAVEMSAGSLPNCPHQTFFV